METPDIKDKIPMPPTKAQLFVPVVFWSTLMLHMDRKIESIIKNYGFGEITMTVKIHNNKISEVRFSDEIKVRDLVEKAGGIGDSNGPQLSPTGGTKSAKPSETMQLLYEIQREIKSIRGIDKSK